MTIKIFVTALGSQYQDVFQGNNLSDEVRNFYNKVNNSDLNYSNGK